MSRASGIVAAVGVLGVVASGCYDPRDPALSSAEVIVVESLSSGTDLSADGYTEAKFQVSFPRRVDAGRSVVVSCSTGVVNLAEDPASDKARTVTLRTTGSALVFSVRVGRTPGPLVVDVALEDYRATASVNLVANPPTNVVLSAAAVSVNGDGVTKIPLTVRLDAPSPKFASFGTQVHVMVCCYDAGGKTAVECDAAAPAPLRVPRRVVLEQGSVIAFDAVTDRLPKTVSAVPRDLRVVATSRGVSDKDLTCGTKVDLQDTIAVTVRPVD